MSDQHFLGMGNGGCRKKKVGFRVTAQGVRNLEVEKRSNSLETRPRSAQGREGKEGMTLGENGSTEKRLSITTNGNSGPVSDQGHGLRNGKLRNNNQRTWKGGKRERRAVRRT